jgi:hypothetical protein
MTLSQSSTAWITSGGTDQAIASGDVDGSLQAEVSQGNARVAGYSLAMGKSAPKLPSGAGIETPKMAFTAKREQRRSNNDRDKAADVGARTQVGR